MSILDHFLRPIQEKKENRERNLIEKHFMPKAQKKGDLFTALKASDNPKVNELTRTALDLTYANLSQQELRQRLNTLIRDLFTKQKQLVRGEEGIPLTRSQLEFVHYLAQNFGDKSPAELAKLFDKPTIDFLMSIKDDRKDARKSRTLSKEQVDSCRLIFGEDAPFCDPQNVFGKMFPAKKSTWLKSYKYWSGQK